MPSTLNKPLLIAIGYWHSEREPHFCRPQALVDAIWDEQERHAVVAHIRQADTAIYYRGYSACRFCGRPNGTSDKSDDLFYFPEGLDHYLEMHQVKPPHLFVDFVLGRDVRRQLLEQVETARQADNAPSIYLWDFEQYLVDFSWWIHINQPNR